MRISDWSSDVCSSDLSEALDAIVVKAADAWRIVAGQARDADVADLAVAEAARRAAVNDQADADPGADGDIGELAEPVPAAPANLGERRAVDVGVEADRNVIGGAQRAGQTGPPPPRLVRRAPAAHSAEHGGGKGGVR